MQGTNLMALQGGFDGFVYSRPVLEEVPWARELLFAPRTNGWSVSPIKLAWCLDGALALFKEGKSGLVGFNAGPGIAALDPGTNHGPFLLGAANAQESWVNVIVHRDFLPIFSETKGKKYYSYVLSGCFKNIWDSISKFWLELIFWKSLRQNLTS